MATVLVLAACTAKEPSDDKAPTESELAATAPTVAGTSSTTQVATGSGNADPDSEGKAASTTIVGTPRSDGDRAKDPAVVCHWASNKYVTIVTSVQGAENGHGNHEEDIIFLHTDDETLCEGQATTTTTPPTTTTTADPDVTTTTSGLGSTTTQAPATTTAAPGSGTTTTIDPNLPYTGAGDSLLALTLAGSILMLLGGGLVTVSRRSRPSRRH